MVKVRRLATESLFPSWGLLKFSGQYKSPGPCYNADSDSADLEVGVRGGEADDTKAAGLWTTLSNKALVNFYL